MKTFVLSVLTSLVLATPAAEFPAQVTAGGKKLVLNGKARRQFSVFKVAIYNGGLYLETPSHDADAVLASPQVKKMEMHYLRDIPAEKMRAGWVDSIGKVCDEAQCAEVKAAMERFVAPVTTDLKEGDVLEMLFVGDAVELFRDRKSLGRVQDAALFRTMPRMWIGGSDSSTAEFRAGLMGK